MFDSSPTRQITVYDIGDLSFLGAPLLERKIDEASRADGPTFSDKANDSRIRLLNSLLSRCRLCHLSVSYAPILPRLEPNPKLLVIGRNPNKGDAATGRLFDSPTQVCRLFNKYLDILQVMYQDVSLLNCCNCYVNRGVAPQPSEILKCRDWLRLYLSSVDVPNTVLLLGNDAIRAFLGDSFPAITSCIGSIIQANVRGLRTTIIPMYHPGQVLRQPELWQDVKAVLVEAQKLRHIC